MHKQAPPNRLRELMAARDVRPAEVAVAIDRDTAMVGRYVRGDSEIPDDIKKKLAEFFEVSRAYLMGWDDDAHVEPEVQAA